MMTEEIFQIRKKNQWWFIIEFLRTLKNNKSLILHWSFFITGCETVKYYPNKRPLATATVVLNTRNMTSEEHCVMSCYYETPGCLAVNVITTAHVITCQMTTGLSNESDIMDDSTSILYVASRQFKNILLRQWNDLILFFFISKIIISSDWIDYNKCAEDPGFCQNGGTCQLSYSKATGVKRV